MHTKPLPEACEQTTGASTRCEPYQSPKRTPKKTASRPYGCKRGSRKRSISTSLSCHCCFLLSSPGSKEPDLDELLGGLRFRAKPRMALLSSMVPKTPMTCGMCCAPHLPSPSRSELPSRENCTCTEKLFAHRNKRFAYRKKLFAYRKNCSRTEKTVRVP